MRALFATLLMISVLAAAEHATNDHAAQAPKPDKHSSDKYAGVDTDLNKLYRQSAEIDCRLGAASQVTREALATGDTAKVEAAQASYRVIMAQSGDVKNKIQWAHAAIRHEVEVAYEKTKAEK